MPCPLLAVLAASTTLRRLWTRPGDHIGDYEDEHHHREPLAPGAVLRELMTMNNVDQSQLPEAGSQGVVSGVLNGRRELNVRPIQALPQRFHVSPAIFFPT